MGASEVLSVVIRPLREADAVVISAAFEEIGWNKQVAQYERYYREQQEQARSVLVAWMEECFAGYLTIMWQSDYPPFREARIPEIVDFNVLKKYWRRGIGTSLMDRAEELIFERHQAAGIGVGMDPNYGAAQRMYVVRGYVPDARGLTYNNH